MCGILGLVCRSGDEIDANTVSLLENVLGSQSHRGPDRTNFTIDKGYFLGSNRLSLVDFYNGGQPMWNREKNVGIIFNGEIYNFKELQSELRKSGIVFDTESDTEVLLKLYESRNLGFLNETIGMFALCILDLKNNILIVARDRLGEKPLYWSHTTKGLLFASELRTLVSCLNQAPTINKTAVADFLLRGFVQEPLSMFEGVAKLEPGNFLVYDLTKDKVEKVKYWNPNLNMKVLIEQIIERVDTAINQVQTSDHMQVICLSAGIDSNYILSKYSRDKQNCIAVSVGYEDDSFVDESHLASKNARTLGIPFHRIIINSNEVPDLYRQICFIRDEPVADLAGIGLFQLGRFIKQKELKIAVTGQGADEILIGYPWVQELLKKRSNENSGEITEWLRKYIGFSKPLFQRRAIVTWLLTGFGLGQNLMNAIRNFSIFGSVSNDISIYSNREFRRRMAVVGRSMGTQKEPMNTFQAYEKKYSKYELLPRTILELTQGYLVSNGLLQSDRLFMHWGIEARTPYVNHQILEMSLAYHGNPEFQDNFFKDLLRSKLFELFPELKTTKSKRGFQPPIFSWTKKIQSDFRVEFKNPLIFQDGIVTKLAIKELRRPFTATLKLRPMWLNFVTLELWYAGFKKLEHSRNHTSEIEPIVDRLKEVN